MPSLDTLSAIKTVINTECNTRLISSTVKVATVTPSNNAVTIDPSLASLFKITCSSNTSITLNTVNNIYTDNGGTISLLLIRSNTNAVIVWPENIVWKECMAPELGEHDMVILTTFDNGTNWYGSTISLDE